MPEIVKYVEPGLLDTLRALRLVNRDFKAVVDDRVFRYVETNRVGLNSMITRPITGAFAGCRILHIASSPGAVFQEPNVTWLPSAAELQQFSVHCRRSPVVMAKDYFLVGWQPDADARLADLLEDVCDLPDHVPVQLKMVAFSRNLSQALVQAIVRVAKKRRWARASPSMRPASLRRGTCLVTVWVVKNAASGIWTDFSYWQNLAEEMGGDEVNMLVKFM